MFHLSDFAIFIGMQNQFVGQRFRVFYDFWFLATSSQEEASECYKVVIFAVL